MKKWIEIEDTFCDVCGARGYADTCLGCGADHCYDCRKNHGIAYSHGVHFQGSGDGYYCHTCDVAMRNNGNPLHAAYRRILELRNEEKAFYEGSSVRSKNAEAVLTHLQETIKRTQRNDNKEMRA